MGLFDSTEEKYGGEFYRKFSQAFDSPDLENYFPKEPVAQQGLCAGMCLVWIQHYVTSEGIPRYSNDDLRQDKLIVVTIQKAVRVRGQPLSDLLVLFGLQLNDNGFYQRKFGIDDTAKIAGILADSPGVHAISYADPRFGPHVVACYVRPSDREMFFFDAHKGDVEVPYPKSAEWLDAYCQIFAGSCGDLYVTSFAPAWSSGQAEQAYSACGRDAKLYK